jgi:hypothetical protein
LDILSDDEERSSFVNIANDTTLRAIKGQHGKFIDWIDSLPTHDGIVLSSEAWSTLSHFERFIPSSVFVTELLIPFR